MVREFTVDQRRWIVEQKLLGRNLTAIQLGYAARYGFRNFLVLLILSSMYFFILLPCILL